MDIRDLAGRKPADGTGGKLDVDARTLSNLLPPAGGWRDNGFPLPKGRIAFRTGRIGTGITATQSRHALATPLRSSISHESPQLILTFGIRGRSNFAIDGNLGAERIVRPGDIWLFQSDAEPMLRETPAGEDVAMFVLKFDAARLGDLTELTGQASGTRALHVGRSVPTADMVRALTANPLKTAMNRLAAESIALNLLLDCLAPCAFGHIRDAAPLSAGERRQVARAIDRLLADLTQPPSLETLAKDIGTSHVRLNRLFRKAYGATVFEWLRGYRLDAASRMLRRDHGRSMTEIAFACGFSSSSHFAAAFRARFACTPQAFRRDRTGH